jgi:hypothetical protein
MAATVVVVRTLAMVAEVIVLAITCGLLYNELHGDWVKKGCFIINFFEPVRKKWHQFFKVFKGLRL